MKKYLYSAVVVALGFIVFTGCTKTDKTTETEKQAAPATQKVKGKTGGQVVVPPAPGDAPKKEDPKQGESTKEDPKQGESTKEDPKQGESTSIQKQKPVVVEPVQKQK